MEKVSASSQVDLKQGSVEHSLEVSDQAVQLSNLVASLSSPCDELLYLFYYRQFTMEAIASRMNYKTT